MAAYLLKDGSVFTIATSAFSLWDTYVITGEVTIENRFWNDHVWGNTDNGESETRGRYQAIGSATVFHDAAATPDSIIASDGLNPGAAAVVCTMTLMTGMTIVGPMHVHNVHILGDSQADDPVKLSFSFRSRGNLTTCDL